MRNDWLCRCGVGFAKEGRARDLCVQFPTRRSGLPQKGPSRADHVGRPLRLAGAVLPAVVQRPAARGGLPSFLQALVCQLQLSSARLICWHWKCFHCSQESAAGILCCDWPGLEAPCCNHCQRDRKGPNCSARAGQSSRGLGNLVRFVSDSNLDVVSPAASLKPSGVQAPTCTA